MSRNELDLVRKAVELDNIGIHEGIHLPNLNASEEQRNNAWNNPCFFDLEVYSWGKWDRNQGGISIQWSEETLGCGRVELYKNLDSVLVIESQCCSKDFVKKLFAAIIDQAKETN